MPKFHGMQANPTGYIWSMYECFPISVCLKNLNTEILLFEDVLDLNL